MTSPACSLAAEPERSTFESSFVLAPREFAAISEIARREFGLELGSGKEQLVAARVGKLMRRRRYATFHDFYRDLESDGTGEALGELIDALTTNHTSFFREPAHFDFLIRHVFPAWKRPDAIRIWSAASATGEEPFTIALMAREHFGVQGENLPRILASDISKHALEIACKGMYQADRFSGVLAPWIKKHLLRGEGRWSGWYRMRPEIMAMVEFRRINLIEPLPDMGRFAVVFCRNVMIYFGRHTQGQVLHRLINCIAPGGYLFLGHSESLSGIQHGLEYIQPAIYRKRGPGK